MNHYSLLPFVLIGLLAASLPIEAQFETERLTELETSPWFFFVDLVRIKFMKLGFFFTD